MFPTTKGLFGSQSNLEDMFPITKRHLNYKMTVCIKYGKSGKQNHKNTNDQSLTVMIIDRRQKNLFHQRQLVMAHPRDPPSGEPVRIASHSERELFRMAILFLSATRRHAAITSGWPLRTGFTNAGYNHGSHYEKVPFSFWELAQSERSSNSVAYSSIPAPPPSSWS